MCILLSGLPGERQVRFGACRERDHLPSFNCWQVSIATGAAAADVVVLTPRETAPAACCPQSPSACTAAVGRKDRGRVDRSSRDSLVCCPQKRELCVPPPLYVINHPRLPRPRACLHPPRPRARGVSAAFRLQPVFSGFLLGYFPTPRLGLVAPSCRRRPRSTRGRRCGQAPLFGPLSLILPLPTEKFPALLPGSGCAVVRGLVPMNCHFLM
ncbi:hypothetical protein MRX96_028143 [Rhipicephalus microplus]